MFWHVFQRASRCPAMQRVVLATDDRRIADKAGELDVPVVMTRADHPSGSDRVHEAAERLNLPGGAVVVNIQGDEPALSPDMLAALVSPFTDPEVAVSTLARPIAPAEALRPDLVKVVLDARGRALYFSRAPIPCGRDAPPPLFLGHIGLYALRMEALRRFVALPRGALERVEQLEQLRLLENNIPIQVVLTDLQSHGVDRPEDIAILEQMLLAEEREGR
jgi:3-deoxy-manno-octulosonate cytidylyltransferase (CMP-KDO synthetase)